MQLVNAHITYYRSIEDSDRLDVEPDVTCLVGKNESGKTTALQAIYRLNPVESSARFDEVIDFPARLTRKRKEFPGDRMIPVVVATFRYDDEEMAEIEKDLGAGALRTPEFTVTIGYRGRSSMTFEHSYDEKKIVEHLRSRLDLSMGAAKDVDAATTVNGLLEALDGLQEPPSSAQRLAERIHGWRDERIGCHLLDTYAMPKMPKFVYFDDYDTMPGKVSIPALIRKRDTEDLTRGEHALLSLLAMAGVELEDFHNTDQHEHLIRELENSGNVISDEVFDYWTQNDQLEVKLSVLPIEQGASPPFNEGPILQIRVHNQRHRASVPFDERSRGFVWFFSFLAYFTDLEEAATNDLILLLDEPGLSLHGRAQKDLLRLIDSRLAPKHQVLYTTHSPFMVAPDHLDRVRTVIDRDKVGTKISSEIFKADSDTVFPLLTSMGIEMTQTLFVGDHTLLLEGPSDLIYLDILSDQVEANGLEGMDARWVKTPIGGSGKLSTFVTLLGANKVHVAVLVDSSTKDVGAVKHLRDNDQLAANGLIEISEFTSTADADIEDLFEPDFYLDLVNRAYAKQLDTPIAATDLNTKDPRIVRQVEAHFRKHDIAGGKLDHFKPAAVLLRQQHDVLDQQPISQTTINRASQLFTRLNALLP
ncbi:ATP-dependent endonuclease [Actinomadura syzygii]|uniref:AAA family ATPase n=1 Tax=Actinomadura syzygii TaxID=1427538 RepID=A0A5D0TTF6_9ACTN|nr:AAA family ATPase [Actinomadura syzygii]TYC08636.1 AAA family ATPase [Actinomadura syzygii]